MRERALVLAILLLGGGCGDDDSRRRGRPPCDTPSSLGRPADPVVMKATQLQTLLGIDPLDVVAFRWAGSWEQVPVQVDERDQIDLTLVYGGLLPGNVDVEEFTDPDTFIGPDSDPSLDGDDEIVFMARDGGSRACAGPEPPGVVPASGIEIEIEDPLDGGLGWVYLFAQTGSLDPGAGQTYVTYTFDLLSGDYKTTYQLFSGPNPEDTTIVTPYFRRHFSDRWITDELNILAGSASGVDILDRHRNLFAPGVCTRSEDTFSDGEGAFLINKSGPVRAIRSYIGANSGPLTQRQHLFYERREDITVYLRVHPVSGVMDFYDYSPDAIGMLYFNEQDTAGFIIDGIPETAMTGPVGWELVTGVQGSLTHITRIEATFPLPGLTLYYLDESSPSIALCTGDAYAYGQSGFWLDQPIPNTDPLLLSGDQLTARRTLFYDEPGLQGTDAARRQEWVAQPLVVTTRPFP